MAIVGASGEVRLFEPPTKPRASMKKLKAAHEKATADLKFKHRIAMRFLRVDYKEDLAAAKKEKKSAEEIAKIKSVFTETMAARKAEFEEKLNALLTAQKAEKEEKKVAFAENYKIDLALWKQEPTITKEEAAALKAEYDAKLAQLKAQKAEIKKQKAAEFRAAKAEADLSVRKLSLAKLKEKFNKLEADNNEAKRVATQAYETEVYSEDKYYKLQKKRKSINAILRDKVLLFMLIPYILFYVVYHYAPYYGIQIAFKDYSIRKGIWASEWVGFKHFKNYIGGPYFWRLVRNTFMINVYRLVIDFPAPIIFALLLNELRSRAFKTVVQTISYLPHFISSVVIAGIVVNFLAPSGLLNHVYVAVKEFFTGQEATPIFFLAKPEYFRLIYTLMGVWAGTGFGSIVYSSAISGIDQELYEAAKIDGAGRLRQALSITIPGIMPTIAIYLIVRVSHMLSVGYETIILLYQPVTYETADVMSTYSYRQGLGSTSGRPNYSSSTAIGLINGTISMILVTTSNKISRKIGDVGLW